VPKAEIIDLLERLKRDVARAANEVSPHKLHHGELSP
jgi:hypothetical protein